jgi:hypothetical protein
MTESEATWRLDDDWALRSGRQRCPSERNSLCLDAICPSCDGRGLGLLYVPMLGPGAMRIYCPRCGRDCSE